MATGICNFDVSQINIAHRKSENETAPVIVLFNREADRTNFYREKKKPFKVRDNHILQPNNEDHSDNEVSLPDLERENSYIYMNESLTSLNRMLLREFRKESNRLKHELPGYRVNGQVRVKSSTNSEYEPINSKQDLVNITKIQLAKNIMFLYFVRGPCYLAYHL